MVESWLDRAAAADAAEDEALGVAARGDEMPAWVADKAKRLAKIREAKAALEAEARDAAARAAQTRAPKRPGPKPKPPADVPADKAQRNFTDPESRILKTKDGFIQGYNAQAAVDAKRQIIVAHALTDSTSDQGQLEPLIDAIEANLGRRPREISADAGYCSKANLEAADRRGIKPYIATGRQKHGQAAAVGPRAAPPGGRVAAMAATLRRAGRRSRYRLRKQTVEPVFGQIERRVLFLEERGFLGRGLLERPRTAQDGVAVGEAAEAGDDLMVALDDVAGEFVALTAVPAPHELDRVRLGGEVLAVLEGGVEEEARLLVDRHVEAPRDGGLGRREGLRIGPVGAGVAAEDVARHLVQQDHQGEGGEGGRRQVVEGAPGRGLVVGQVAPAQLGVEDGALLEPHLARAVGALGIRGAEPEVAEGLEALGPGGHS